MLISTEDAIDEVMRLERTVGFVKSADAEGIAWRNRLVDGLVSACSAHGVAPNPIIDRCLELSKHCPTDFDLHTVAGIIREDARSKEKPEPTSHHCRKCNGTGWEQVYSLHTMEGEGEFRFKRRDWITRGIYESLQGRLGEHQTTHSGVRRCDHAKAALDWTTQLRAEHDEKWSVFCADPKNSKILKGMGSMIGARLGVRGIK